MASDDHLREVRRHTAESIEFLANQKKPERERCVVRAFFRELGVPFQERDLLVQQPEPVDVAAFDARFQITEILDSGRKRHQEYRERLAHLESLESDTDLWEAWENPQALSSSEVVNRVAVRLSEKMPFADIDALVYFNLHHTFLDPHSGIPEVGSVSHLGWRSVSVIFVPYALVLYAAASAPPFIRTAVGFPRMEWSRLDGLFEPGA